MRRTRAYILSAKFGGVDIGLIEGEQARANLSQVRVVDTRRLQNRIGFLDKAPFDALRKAARAML